jgi:membrane-bound ClpP family serine protease
MCRSVGSALLIIAGLILIIFPPDLEVGYWPIVGAISIILGIVLACKTSGYNAYLKDRKKLTDIVVT